MVSRRVDVRPELYDFARARSGIRAEEWQRRFPKFESWHAGESKPTFKQLQDFANKTHTPVGWLLLSEPPDEQLPIADFRTARNRTVKADANLLDTIYAAQARQEWFRHHQLLNNEPQLDWIGSATPDLSEDQAASLLADAIKWTAADRQQCRTWDAVLTGIRDAAEDSGVLVMIAGHAGRSTRRKLEPSVFRGFSLSDDYAPVVFVNGTDRKAAQIFTLVHELSHLLAGSTALVDVDPQSDERLERWCNRTAAEFLMPELEFRDVQADGVTDSAELDRLATHFKVSTQAILGRLRELGDIDWDSYWQLRATEQERIAALMSAGDPKLAGGNYYNSRPVQVSKRFSAALIASTYEGRTSFTEAMRLIGTRKVSTLETMGERLGVL